MNNKIILKKLKIGFNIIYYFGLITLLVLSLLLLLKPNIFFNDFNKTVNIDNKNYHIKFNKLEGNVFQGLYFYNMKVSNNNIEYFCSQVFIKPVIPTFFTNKKIFDEINIKCSTYNINNVLNKNVEENIKYFIDNKINNKIVIKKLKIVINELKFKFTQMNNFILNGNYDFINNNKIYNFDITFKYFNKNYHLNINN